MKKKKNIPKVNQKSPLYNMFHSVSEHYDILNRILTLSLDNLWRAYAVKQCIKNRPSKILDLCCGTGDLAIQVAAKSDYKNEIIGLDYSSNMLRVAQRKAGKYPAANLRFIHADASGLDFPDEHFDTIGISFAFRNLTYNNRNSDKYLAEITRVLKKPGRFVIVETSQPRSKIIRKAFHFYMRNIAAPIGGLISRHPEAYRYLSTSAINYFDKKEMVSFLNKHGFSRVTYKSYLFGVTSVFVAEK